MHPLTQEGVEFHPGRNRKVVWFVFVCLLLMRKFVIEGFPFKPTVKVPTVFVYTVCLLFCYYYFV